MVFQNCNVTFGSTTFTSFSQSQWSLSAIYLTPQQKEALYHLLWFWFWPMVPEVGFEVAMTQVCSWNIVLRIYCFYLHAIDRYRGYYCIIIPVTFPRYHLPGYGAKNFFRTNVWCRQWHTSCDNFYQAFSILFILQATIAVVEDWEQG